MVEDFETRRVSETGIGKNIQRRTIVWVGCSAKTTGKSIEIPVDFGDANLAVKLEVHFEHVLGNGVRKTLPLEHLVCPVQHIHDVLLN